MTMTRSFEPSIERKCQTIGQALPGVEVAIIDPETHDLAPIGTDGEICCRGFNTMKGYYKMPEQTAQCIDERGWLHSGDIGRMDADGYYYITGRLKDLIIRGGENISPKEVEDFLGTMPGVKDVAVVGCPSKKYEEVRRTARRVHHPRRRRGHQGRGRRGLLPQQDLVVQDPEVRPLHGHLPDDRVAEDTKIQAARTRRPALAQRLTANRPAAITSAKPCARSRAQKAAQRQGRTRWRQRHLQV